MGERRSDVTGLWLLRHGQSQGNVIRAAAAQDAEALDIPHRPEATDLAPTTAFHADPREVVTSAAERYGAGVTMEGRVAATDGRRWLNDERVSGLGMGSSGDVLAGLVAGGAAQHADVAWATCRATYLHLAAGKAAAQRIGPIGYLARELLGGLTRVLLMVTP